MPQKDNDRVAEQLEEPRQQASEIKKVELETPDVIGSLNEPSGLPENQTALGSSSDVPLEAPQINETDASQEEPADPEDRGAEAVLLEGPQGPQPGESTLRQRQGPWMSL